MKKDIFKFLVLLAVAIGAGPAYSAMWQWSKVAANNATADPSINYAEGMSPSSVNDSARAAMARTAEWRDDISGLLTTGGTSTAYTVTTNQTLNSPTPTDGQMISVTVHVTNGAAPTLSADAGTGFGILSAPSTPVAAGTLVAGSPYTLKFSASGGAWMLRDFYGSPFTVPLGGVVMFTGDTVPNSNFAFATGGCISRATYAAYFAMVGTRFSACDGVSTFGLPDLRERIAGFQGTMGGASSPSRITTAGGSVDGLTVGASGGAQNRTVAQANLPNLTWPSTLGVSFAGVSWSFPTRNYSITGGAGAPQQVQDDTGSPTINVGVTMSGTPTVSGSVTSGGSGTALQTLPPMLILTALVRIF